MAEPLKNQFGVDVPHAIAAMVRAVYPAFDMGAFVRSALTSYDALALTQRGHPAVKRALADFGKVPKADPRGKAVDFGCAA